MKPISEFTREAWESGDYTGERRPIIRATISKWHMSSDRYLLRWSKSSTWKHNGKFRSAHFNWRGPVREFKNIKSIKISRGLDQDAATLTIVLYNVQWFANQNSARPEEFDFPGWFTPNRGESSRWDYTSNRWKNWLLPDRMIKTFGGYGYDFDEVPEADPHMQPSGVWLIDDVEFGSDGMITITARDCARLLLDQYLYPTIVPWDVYPLVMEPRGERPQRSHLTPSGEWVKPPYFKDSNEYVLAAGLLDGTHPAVNPNGKCYGHQGSDARDADTSTYWLSAGSADPNQLEWIQFNLDTPASVSAVKLNVKGGPYKIYISVSTSSAGWKGGATIPYEIAEDGVDNQADIPYVSTHYVAPGESDQFRLPREYQGVNKIRITFASRWRSGIGQERFYRTALQEFGYCSGYTVVPGEGNVPTGNYDDYTDVVKWLLGWAGFFWPKNATQQWDRGITQDMDPARTDDDTLPGGYIWGDLMGTGTKGIAPLGVDVFDKRPVMDGINAVRDIIGYDFWIDETGAAIWRLPNVYKRGSYVMPTQFGPTRTRTQNLPVLDERVTLVDVKSKLSSRNVRERIFVADVNGNFGAVVRGYNPAPTGIQRVAGWTDQNFRRRSEARQMADLIAIRQAYLYRTCQVTIAANPALQLDDQVIIRERLTGEDHLHRITAIEETFDYEDGRWMQTLTTNWLGNDAFTERAWEPEISDSTKNYLNMLENY